MRTEQAKEKEMQIVVFNQVEDVESETSVHPSLV